MGGYIKDNNLVLQIELVKFRGNIATVAIKDQQLIAANSIILCMLIEYLYQLGQANFVSYLAIITNTNRPVIQYNPVLVLGSLVYYCLKDNQRQNYVSPYINSFNYYNLFLITQLYYPRSTSPISSSNNLYSCDNTYLVAGLIKILGIFIKNPILYFYILNTFKLALNKYRILVFSTLIVILMIIFRLQVVVALNKSQYLSQANQYWGS